MPESNEVKMARIKKAILSWSTIMTNLHEEEYPESDRKKYLDQAKKIKNNILSLEKELKLKPSDMFRIMAELI